jgi:hypothetical protein
MFNKEQMADHKEDVNCAPRSLVMIAGTPKRDIQPWNIAEAHSAAEIPAKGITSGHLVDLSIQVKRYVKPCDEGRGPTRST